MKRCCQPVLRDPIAWLVCLALLSGLSCRHGPDAKSGPGEKHLAPLAWMVGEWEETVDGKTVRNVCRWSRNRNFLTRTFTITEQGQPAGRGTEVYGWDPVEQRIRSWTFDSDGGYARLAWVADGDALRSEPLEDLPPGDPEARRRVLDSLDWLIGTWIDEGGGERVESTYSRSPGRAFLVQRFKVDTGARTEQEGLVVVGWDDTQKALRTWLFDTDGGFAEGTGTARGEEWYVHNRYVLPDGRLGSAISVYRRIDADRYAWRRIATEVDGALFPDTDEIIVVRVADAPRVAEEARR